MTASAPVPGPAPAGARSVWNLARRTLAAHPEQVVLPVLAAGVVWVVAQVLVEVAIGATITRGTSCLRSIGALVGTTTCGPTGSRTGIGLAVSVVVLLVLGQLFWAVCLRAGLVALGVPVRPLRTVIGPVVGLAAFLGPAIAAGLAVCLLPGFAVAFFGQFAMTGVVRDGLGPFAAIGGGLREVARRPLATVSLTAVSMLVLVAGALLGLVGVWPASALVALAQLEFLRPAEAPPKPRTGDPVRHGGHGC